MGMESPVEGTCSPATDPGFITKDPRLSQWPFPLTHLQGSHHTGRLIAFLVKILALAGKPIRILATAATVMHVQNVGS
jgi:hypothetical protein